MNIGRLSQRIKLFKPDMVDDGQGGQKPNPDNETGLLEVAEIWAAVQKPKILSLVLKDAPANEIIQEFWVRYFPDLKMGWQVESEGTRYKILTAYNEAKVKTVIICREVVRFVG